MKTAVNFLHSFRPSRISIQALFCVLGFLLTGCHAELASYCSGQSGDELKSAIVALKPWRDAQTDERPSGRAPASSGIPALAGAKALPAESREVWLVWAEKELKKAQTALDWVSIHRGEIPKERQVRADLSEAANQFVSFHGYCQQGRVDRMIASLEKLDRLREQIRTLGCHSGR